MLMAADGLAFGAVNMRQSIAVSGDQDAVDRAMPSRQANCTGPSRSRS